MLNYFVSLLSQSSAWGNGSVAPTYEPGDYVKAEFSYEATGVGEWMWIRVLHCDDEKKLVFGRLDNEPLNNGDKIELGSELAVAYSKIREHRKQTEFTKQ